MSICMQDFVYTELFLETHCDRNYDGTRNLILRGNDLFKKIGERVNDGDLITIVSFLRKRPEVIALEFPYNEISDCGMSTLADFLKERPIIRYLNLIGNNIGPRGIKYFADLGEILLLYTLRLSGNKIGDEGGKILSNLMSKNIPMKFLDLSDTHQTVTGLTYLIASLIKNKEKKTLKYLDISRPLPQTYHQTPDAHLAELISQLLEVNAHLEEIHLRQYQFDFRDMEILIYGLSANKTLVCLDLNNNNLGDDGVEFICQYLKNSTTLECLMIGSNNIGNFGAMALGFSLPFSQIKLLDITHNHITDEGMINIFYTIKKKIPLRALFIWGNNLTNTSLVVLQRLFKSKLLDPRHTDVKLYCSNNEVKAAWNSFADRYNHRFYCVSDYGYPPPRKILKIPMPPLEPPSISYRHHADAVEMGQPLSDWHREWIQSKFFDPL